MPSIVATPIPALGAVVVQIDWADLPSVTHAKVVRSAYGYPDADVRVHTVAENGWYIELSAGLAVIYDTEAPMDVPLEYTTIDLTGTDSVTITVPVIMPSGSDCWLKAPLRPWADRRVVLDVPQDADCIPSNALFFASMDSEARANRTRSFVVNNARLPISTTRTRGGITSTLTIVSRKFSDRDDVIDLNAAGDPLFWEAPAAYGIPNQYMTVQDYTVGRLSADHKVQWRTHSMPYIEVDRPAGLADGVLGNRWADQCDLYATFADAEAADLSWTAALLGYGALVPTPPITAIYRLYSDIPLDFATYADIPLGGRTYVDLLEDR